MQETNLRQSFEVQIGCSNETISALISPGSKSSLLCLHGLQSNGNLFDDWIGDPRFADHEIIAPDFLGFGCSSKPESSSYDIAEQIEMLSGIIDKLDLNDFVVVGHSLGGMTGILLSEKFPTRISALVNMEGNLTAGDCGASRAAKTTPFEQFQNEIYPNLKQKLTSSSDRCSMFRKKAVELIPDYVFYKTSRSIVEWSESGELLEKFTSLDIPKLLVLGEDSHYQSRPEAPTMKTVFIPNAGHFMPLENARATKDVVADFLNELNAS